jgi:segregation and condensation protein B
MNESYLKNVIEAALFAAGRPLTVIQIAQLFDEHVRPTTAEVRAQLTALTSDYESRGIEMKETASGFRVQVRGALASEISRLWPERPPRFSRALLETLALIAYRQPITRAEIEAVRGVAVNPNIVKTLPGHPELLGTTREFLDYFGLKTLDELPPLAALTAMADVNLQLDLGEGARMAATEAGDTSAAVAAMLDEDSTEDDEHAAASAAASELVAAGPHFDP